MQFQTICLNLYLVFTGTLALMASFLGRLFCGRLWSQSSGSDSAPDLDVEKAIPDSITSTAINTLEVPAQDFYTPWIPPFVQGPAPVYQPTDIIRVIELKDSVHKLSFSSQNDGNTSAISSSTSGTDVSFTTYGNTSSSTDRTSINSILHSPPSKSDACTAPTMSSQETTIFVVPSESLTIDDYLRNPCPDPCRQNTHVEDNGNVCAILDQPTSPIAETISDGACFAFPAFRSMDDEDFDYGSCLDEEEEMDELDTAEQGSYQSKRDSLEDRIQSLIFEAADTQDFLATLELELNSPSCKLNNQCLAREPTLSRAGGLFKEDVNQVVESHIREFTPAQIAVYCTAPLYESYTCIIEESWEDYVAGAAC